MIGPKKKQKLSGGGWQGRKKLKESRPIGGPKGPLNGPSGKKGGLGASYTPLGRKGGQIKLLSRHEKKKGCKQLITTRGCGKQRGKSHGSKGA